MFVDEKQQGEAQTAEQANRKLKLSEAIRIGKPLVGSEEVDFRLCALGCAWAGYNGRRMTERDLVHLMMKHRAPRTAMAFGRELGFPDHIAQEVSKLHCGGMPALQIADHLQEQGY